VFKNNIYTTGYIIKNKRIFFLTLRIYFVIIAMIIQQSPGGFGFLAEIKS
jgi:hypothetical protein